MNSHEPKSQQNVSRLAPVRGPGRMQWNAGSWFGALLGCTLWMLLASGTVLVRQHRVPWLLLAALAASLTLGVLLWRLRARLAPYAAIQLLLAGLCVTSSVALGRLRVAWGPEGQSWAYLAVLPGLMVFFHLLESRARRAGPD